MARIRTIKPEFWRSPDTAKASPLARLLYIAMWNWADDYGFAEWTPRELLGFAFPNDEDIETSEFQRLCEEVARCFSTVFYVVNGRRFYCIPAWDDHQKTERRASAKHPAPDDAESSPDQAFTRVEEMRGNTAANLGKTPAGKGTGEQGNRGTGEREQGKSLTATDREFDRDLIALFDSAYSHWPKKVKRDEALAKFKGACKTNDADEIAAHIVRFGDAYATTTDKQFVPALGVWLNGQRWTDELPSAHRDSSKPTPTDSVMAILNIGGDRQKGLEQ